MSSFDFFFFLFTLLRRQSWVVKIIIFQKKKEIYEDRTGLIYTILSSFLNPEENEKEIERRLIKVLKK